MFFGEGGIGQIYQASSLCGGIFCGFLFGLGLLDQGIKFSV
jgi:hypothetical protein